MTLARKIIICGAFSVLCILITSMAAGYFLTTAYPQQISHTPKGAAFKDFSFTGHGGILLKAWLAIAKRPKAAVLLLHGVHSNRKEMLSRAKLLWRNGYTVLLYDSRAHGMSEGDKITFGYLESLDAEMAFTALKQQAENLPIAALGMSMGGAAIVLGNTAYKADAIVLEAVYPTLELAIENRINMHIGGISALIKPLILPQIKYHTGAHSQWFSPIEAISKIDTPTLIVGGLLDQRTTHDQTVALYQAAKGQSELYIVENAAHENFHNKGIEDYEARLLSFLEAHMPGQN